MLNFIRRFILSCFVMCFAQIVLAEDGEVSVVGGVAYNLKNVEFNIGEKPFAPEFVTLDWSVIAAYQSYYVKFNYDQSVKDYFQINNTPSGGGGNDTGSILLEREDVGITFGYSITDNASLFGGYTRGETSGIATGSYESNLATFPADSKFRNSTVSFKEDGPFIGVSYSHYLKSSGSFSFSAAYAQLDGEVVIDGAETALDTGVTTFSSDAITGDANGFSYSVTWSDQFSDSVLYNISLKSTKYKFDAPLTSSGDSFDFDEIYKIFSIGFSKFF